MDAYIEQLARGEATLPGEEVSPRPGGRRPRTTSACEYVREKDGAVRHVCQCCCECDEVDGALDKLLAQGKIPTTSDWRRMENDVTERLRVPWCGGAVRVSMFFFAIPMVMFGCDFFVPNMLAGKEGGLWACIPGRAFDAFIVYMSAKCMQSHIEARTKMHLAYTFWAAVETAYVFFPGGALDSGTALIGKRFLVTALTAVGVFGCLVKFLGPGVVVGVDPPVKFDAQSMRRFYASHPRLRAKYCLITKSVVRRYDHYCIWLASPVGSGNHAAFVGFLAGLSACALTLSYCIAGTVDSFTWQQLGVAVRAFAAGVAVWLLLLRQCFLISMGETTYEHRHGLRKSRSGNCGDVLRNWWAFFH